MLPSQIIDITIQQEECNEVKNRERPKSAPPVTPNISIGVIVFEKNAVFLTKMRQNFFLVPKFVSQRRKFSKGTKFTV